MYLPWGKDQLRTFCQQGVVSSDSLMCMGGGWFIDQLRTVSYSRTTLFHEVS